MQPQQIAVIGAGTMGHGIAQVFATHGFRTRLVDINAESLDRAMRSIGHSLERLQNKQQISANQSRQALQSISLHQDLDSVASADLVIEAVVEDEAVKLDLFSRLDQLCQAHTVLASNTSSISLTRLAGATRRPQQVVGMHFMNPVPLMPLVELVRAIQTDNKTMEYAQKLCRDIDKTAVEVNDSPGFVSNRLLMPMINEAITAHAEGIASREAIDDIMKLGMNHPIGPLALADLIGLDTCLSIMQVLQRELNDGKYHPAPLLQRMTDAGYLGRKSGRGFYQYDANGKMIR